MRMTLKDYLKNVKDDNTALIGVDLQNDFGDPKGSLYVKGGEKLGEISCMLADEFANMWDRVFWTQDFHPKNHCSFKDNGGVWPTHCVQDEWGSEIMFSVVPLEDDTFIFKGTDPAVDSYSAFFDNDKKTQTILHETLQKLGIKKLLVMGIATDYCVKFTALDALKLGYEVALYLPGCVGVGPIPGVTDKTVDDAIKEMEDAETVIVTE